MEVYNFLKHQCGGETLYPEVGASILKGFFSANTLAKKLLPTVYDPAGQKKQQPFQNATMYSPKCEICSSEDAVCLISDLTVNMNKYESLVRYTKRKLL